ncbi:MAG: hypothetical protein ACKVK3_03940 [Acidimicrobiales bacterium]|jgi:hypothetical protein
MALSQEQRSGLWQAKLRSIARDHFGRDGGVGYAVPWGAAIETDGAWTASLEVAPERSFGQALVLAARHNATSLDLVVEENPGAVARRASLFKPSPSVWRIQGKTLTPAEPEITAPIEPADLEPHIQALLTLDDVDIIVEHGAIIGECLGLEVARVTGAGAEQRLDVGVGAYDQGAFAVINPGMTPVESLAEVVTQVLTHRRSDALTHPINRLVRERWVRCVLLADPAAVGLTHLEIVEPMQQRSGIKDIAAASALGKTATGELVLVACTVGIDLDAVPAAVDLAERHQTDRILMVMPDRDRHAVVQAVAARSRRPIGFATAPEPWPS